MGGRRDERLESGSWSMPPLLESGSSSPDSSSDDGVVGRRAGGNFSPKAMVRVGGGGSRPRPLDLRSVTGEGTISGMTVVGRTGRGGGGDCVVDASSIGATVERRLGRGGGVCVEDAELGESRLLIRGLGRGGGGGGTTTDGRNGGAKVDWGKCVSILVSLLSTDMKLEPLDTVLSEDSCL
jgi:hypothetical protein